MNPCIDKSLHIENVVPERKLRCRDPRFEPGGGGINVSRAVHKLGGEADAVYVSGGPLGELLQDLLQAEEIRHSTVEIKNWTRESLIVYEKATGQQFRFSEPGPVLSSEEWRKCLHIISEYEPVPDAIVASGGLPAGVPEDFYASIAETAKTLGAKTYLDSSGNALRYGVEAGVFLIKPNLRELKGLADHNIDDESDQETFARKMIEEGKCKVVVISKGSAGVLMVTEEESRQIRAPTVPIKSKVGAGDSMVAGIALAMARDHSLIKSVRFGVAAGAAAVMTPGTELCRRSDTERLFDRMN